MDNIISINFIYASQCLQTRLQNIATEMDRSPTTPDRYRDLTHQLGESFKDLQVIKEQAAAIFSAKNTLEVLEDKIISLYGRLETDLFYTEAVEIHQNAAAIHSGITNGIKSGKDTAKAIKELALRLETFKNKHCPSIEERQLIADAEHIMASTVAFLKGEPLENRQKPLQQGKIVFEEIDSFALSEMEEIMGITSLIYNRDLRQARSRYIQLPEAYKNRFLEHMEYLQATPFTDRFETIQALIALVNELVNNGESYLTPAQIDELFLGLSQECMEDETQDKVFSLRSKGSRSR